MPPTPSIAPPAGQNGDFALIDPRAKDTKSIYSAYIESKICRDGLTAGLGAAGIRVSSPGEDVDVILRFSLSRYSGWRSNWPLLDDYIIGFFTSATYKAAVIGKDNRVLLTLYGEEWALTGRELCQDIGDNLGARLTQRD